MTPMRRIAFINEKGGTCKTTLAVNVAAWLAREKKRRVLLVDLDTQGHAGKSLGLDVRSLTPNVFHLLTQPELPLSEVIRPSAVERLSVIPAYKEMSRFAEVVAQQPRRDFLLADRLEQEAAKAFDVVVFDAPPSLGLTSRNILMAATEVVVPVALTYFALDGCAEVVNTVREVAESHERPGLRVTRVVPTLYRKTALADEILGKLRSYFPDAVSTPLGFNVKIDEAQSHGRTIWEYAPRSKGAQMLAAIAREVEAAGAGQARARQKASQVA
jgi:chromosome partitioning protein